MPPLLLLQPTGEMRVHWKGAAEIIVGLCSNWMSLGGQIMRLDEEMVRRNVLPSSGAQN